jgi:hypothetical protein
VVDHRFNLRPLLLLVVVHPVVLHPFVVALPLVVRKDYSSVFPFTLALVLVFATVEALVIE